MKLSPAIRTSIPRECVARAAVGIKKVVAINWCLPVNRSAAARREPVSL